MTDEELHHIHFWEFTGHENEGNTWHMTYVCHFFNCTATRSELCTVHGQDEDL